MVQTIGLVPKTIFVGDLLQLPLSMVDQYFRMLVAQLLNKD